MNARAISVEPTDVSTPRPLPKNWRLVRLDDIATFQHGGTPSKDNQEFWEGSIPWVSPKDMRTGIIHDSVDHISDGAVANSSTRLIQSGALLVVVRSGILARTIPIAIAGTSLAFNQDIKAIIGDSDAVNSNYLFWALRSQENHILSNGIKKGATVHSIKSGFIESLKIALPPLIEQERIATTLNEQMNSVERARAAAEAQFKTAKSLRAAYLRTMFESVEAQRWPKKPLGDIGQIASGITLGRKLREEKTRIIPYLRVANVKDGHLDLSDLYKIEATETEIEKLLLRYGDILLTEGGDPDKLGRGTFWDDQLPECIHQNHIFRVRFDLEQFHPPFIAAQISSTYGKAYFLAHAKQTTGIATINQKVLAGFPLMIPPFEQQRSIAETLNEQAVIAARVLQSLQDQSNAIKSLPAAFLRRAFNGEL